MLNRMSTWRHVIVGSAIVTMMLLAGFRVIGAGADSAIRPEHFDAKQVTVWPDGDDGVRIREVVDIDFGLAEKRGYQRIVRNDFGVPIDVTAESPDANADLAVVDTGVETRMRIGDPNVTFTGRHRYILEYTLPEAGVATGALFLDVIGNDETMQTRRFEVVLTGFDDPATDCDTGAYDALGGCEFIANDQGNQVAVIEPLAPGESITIGATYNGLAEPNLPPVPAPPDPLPSGFQPLGWVMLPLGLGAALLVFLLGRSYGSNTVLAGGASEAAFGDLPLPGQGARSADTPTYRVPDSRLAELATIEFVPPRGLEPWQAAAVLRESIDDDTVAAWFAEMIATDALVISDDDGRVELRLGPDTSRLSAVDLGHLHRLFAGGDVIELGTYDPAFTATWACDPSGTAGVRRRSRLVVAWRTRRAWDHPGPRGRDPCRRSRRARLVRLRGDRVGNGLLPGDLVTVARRDRWVPGSPGGRRRRIQQHVPVAHRHRLRTRVAVGVVPTIPGGERGQARRVGVAAGSAARVQRLGGRARRCGCVDRGGAVVEHLGTAGRARRAVARALGGVVVLVVAHRPIEFGRWRRGRWRRRRRRWQLRVLVNRFSRR